MYEKHFKIKNGSNLDANNFRQKIEIFQPIQSFKFRNKTKNFKRLLNTRPLFILSFLFLNVFINHNYFLKSFLKFLDLLI